MIIQFLLFWGLLPMWPMRYRRLAERLIQFRCASRNDETRIGGELGAPGKVKSQSCHALANSG